jgi:hypothetical protein
MSTATPIRNVLEDAKLRRQVKGNNSKEESPKKRTKPSAQNNKRKSGNSRQESSKRKKKNVNHGQEEIFLNALQMRKTIRICLRCATMMN